MPTLTVNELSELVLRIFREESKPILPERMEFSKPSFAEKKAVAARFIQRIEVGEISAEIWWPV